MVWSHISSIGWWRQQQTPCALHWAVVRPLFSLPVHLHKHNASSWYVAPMQLMAEYEPTLHYRPSLPCTLPPPTTYRWLGWPASSLCHTWCLYAVSLLRTKSVCQARACVAAGRLCVFDTDVSDALVVVQVQMDSNLRVSFLVCDSDLMVWYAHVRRTQDVCLSTMC